MQTLSLRVVQKLGIDHVNLFRKAHDRIMRKHFGKRPFVLHDLRHTYATTTVKAGCSPFVLKSLLGHANLEMTSRYVHPAQTEKQLAFEKFQAYLNELKKRGKSKEEADCFEAPNGTRQRVEIV
jgi:integrase